MDWSYSNDLYKIAGGPYLYYLRINHDLDTNECNYDYFDWTKTLLKSGTFKLKPSLRGKILNTVFKKCGIDFEKDYWVLIQENADNEFLEMNGFKGFMKED